MNQATPAPTSGRFARPGLVASWLLLLGAGFLFGSHQTLAIVAICLVVVVRHFTTAEAANTFPTPGYIIPFLLIVGITFGVSMLPERYREHAYIWVLPPSVFLFLAWCVVQEVRRYRRAPRFFSSQ